MKRILILLLCCTMLCGCTANTITEPSTSPPTTEPTTTITTEPEITVPSVTVPLTTEPPTTEPVTTEPPTTEPPTTEPEKPQQQPTEPAGSLDAMIAGMSLEERVGQMFLARCPNSNTVSDIQTYHLGGYVLFARDFENETPSSVTQTIDKYQDASKIPLLIAVDEEGGTVNRVSRYAAFRDRPFPSPRNLFDEGGLDAVKTNEIEKSQLLSSLGINVNLSPVCDITTDPEAFMFRRSLGQSPEITGQYVQMMLDTMGQNGVGGVLKHFPGYGNNTDTHVAIAIDNRSLADLESCDLVPFQMGIDSGCGAIMVSHTFINAIDDQVPATLSPAVNQYLRQNMGFDGVVVTDDLVMQAITDLYGAGESAVLAVQAGNDLLCSTEYKVQYNAVLEAVKSGRISEQRINEAVYRILKWKCAMGLMKL